MRGLGHRLWPLAVALLAGLSSVAAACGAQAPAGGAGETGSPERGSAAVTGAPAPGDSVSEPLEALEVRVLAAYPHDREAFTQGLLFVGDRLYESTGQFGSSTLRRVDPETGEVEQRVPLADDLFGEGLARVEDRLIQITWNNGEALVWDLETFEEITRHRYDGEGWGLAYDGRRLLMSDGSYRLTFRDPETFRVTGSVEVTENGRRVPALNELEWVEGALWANLWTSEEIVRIDPETGRVSARVDLTGLRRRLPPPEPGRPRPDVLNGIAYHPERETFWVTGKFWPLIFEVVFEPPSEASPEAADPSSGP